MANWSVLIPKMTYRPELSTVFIGKIPTQEDSIRIRFQMLFKFQGFTFLVKTQEAY